ncbi:MAG: mannose-1-phosphate guanylyltransferase/mannose-6-phosphate isomerase [Prochlorococcus marinus CUG1439]|uniref:mannose-1-phosphate guanylyltransferase/mannose-6-phosphate isomerase n=1 Tax=Prochlorococcus sp. MIT 1314 TaxID=3096220 RepID=UPI001B19F303|nr:mannose-1-phosphate guanylyltransferase/mannose-6-phosphate isomerase [Prochlorococcus sp. MIT 1314]MCR8538783.1 mannose-1-phosphate guanylyltransferase/mannose-6-phosphate isomerase [Prochlorococcus marinus CUG1439]
MRKIIPIILAGGTGSRLWPLSRESYPKQFLNLTDDENYSLIQKTYKRIENIENITNPIIICNEEHRFIVGDQMNRINTKPLSIILEPEGRNTAPAIAVASLKALQEYKDPILLILSSDHEIRNVPEFTKSIKNSIKIAEEGKLVIFGIIPTYPSTGYGYIKSSNKENQNKYITSNVEKFIEKPDLKTAQKLFQDKHYTWNSGMFVFKASSILNELKVFAPEIIKNCEKCLIKSLKDLDFLRLDKKSFTNCPNISIDYAVFEKTKKAFVLPLNCGWNDIGTWESLWKISRKDSEGNAIKGKVLVKDTKNSLIRSEEKLVVSIGLDNIIIIETKDAVLVADKNKSQKVKDIVNSLNEKGLIEGRQHKIVFRPWGYYLSIEKDSTWQIKKIEVNPGASLSLQMHKYRSEHWIVVKGKAMVEVDKKEYFLSKNESTYIPLGSKHRLSNPGITPLILLEVQSGDYLGEDDIVRFADNYGRN